jgi:long-chain acyl-CoA synthetase
VHLLQVDAVLDDVQQGSDVAQERQELDNAAFAAKVTAVAALFAAAGLRPGGVLAIMLPNRVELVTSMFAAWRLGAAVTPVNPALTAQEARYQIADAGAALVVADNEAAAALGDGLYRIIGLDEVVPEGQCGDHSSYGGPSTAPRAGRK